MAGKKDKAISHKPGRLTATVDPCTRLDGARVHPFFVGCEGPSWPSQSATDTHAELLARSGACGALASSPRGAGAERRPETGVSGICRFPDRTRITMGAGDAVLIKRTIFCIYGVTLLHEYERAE